MIILNQIILKSDRQWFIENYFKNTENVYEFGCGSSFNLLHVNRVFPEKKRFGSDFVQSSDSRK